MRIRIFIVIGAMVLCFIFAAVAALFPHHEKKGPVASTLGSMVTIDVSGSLDARKFGFSGHPSETHREFIGHRMVNVVLPGKKSATFEVGIWQLFQADGKILSVNVFSPAMSLDGAYKLASKYLVVWKLPGQERLDAWKTSWSTPKGLSKIRRGYVTRDDNWTGELFHMSDGWVIQVGVETTYSGVGEDYDWTVTWGFGRDPDLWH
jgi:hypothetical protein